MEATQPPVTTNHYIKNEYHDTRPEVETKQINFTSTAGNFRKVERQECFVFKTAIRVLSRADKEKNWYLRKEKQPILKSECHIYFQGKIN